MRPLLRPGRGLDPQPTDWDEAIRVAASQFRRILDRFGADSVALYLCGQLLTEDLLRGQYIGKDSSARTMWTPIRAYARRVRYPRTHLHSAPTDHPAPARILMSPPACALSCRMPPSVTPWNGPRARRVCQQTLWYERLACLAALTPRAGAGPWASIRACPVRRYFPGTHQSARGVATGRIAKAGAGPFSLTGQPNAMGGREVGGLAGLLAGSSAGD